MRTGCAIARTKREAAEATPQSDEGNDLLRCRPVAVERTPDGTRVNLHFYDDKEERRTASCFHRSLFLDVLPQILNQIARQLDFAVTRQVLY